MKHSMHRLVVVVAAGVLALTTAAVEGATCAGFTDVAGTDAFCPNVDWLRNRKVTLGCGDGTTYCPNDYVTRLQMAAFMNRLGVGFTPIVLTATQRVITPDPLLVICETADVPLTDFRRFMSAVATLMVEPGPNPAYILARPMFSTDGGQTWQAFDLAAEAIGADYARGPVDKVYGPTTLTALGNERAVFGGTFRFGVQVTLLVEIVSGVSCQLRVSITNRNGANFPF